ncbi:Protein of unknown function [Bacillus cytotoxicus]|nr:Protein of unknown function [Bacillus cytotoxicus]
MKKPVIKKATDVIVTCFISLPKVTK